MVNIISTGIGSATPYQTNDIKVQQTNETAKLKGIANGQGIDHAQDAPHFAALKDTKIENPDAQLTRLGRDFLETQSPKALAGLLSQLLIEAQASQRQNALEQRLNAKMAAKAELEGQASEMRESADKMRTGAIVTMVITSVSSAVSLGASGFSLKASKQSVAKTKEAGAMQKELDLDIKMQNATVNGKGTFSNTPHSYHAAGNNANRQAKIADLNAEASAISTRAQSISTNANTVAQFGTSMGGVSKTFLDADIKNLDSDGSLHAAEAEEDKALADNYRAIETAAEEMIKHMINFLKELQNSEVEQMSAIVKG